MTLFAVSLTVDMVMELEASSKEAAMAIVAKAFASQNAYDPLTNIDIVLDKNTGIHASVKTTMIQNWEVPEMDAWEAM